MGKKDKMRKEEGKISSLPSWYGKGKEVRRKTEGRRLTLRKVSKTTKLSTAYLLQDYLTLLISLLLFMALKAVESILV